MKNGVRRINGTYKDYLKITNRIKTLNLFKVVYDMADWVEFKLDIDHPGSREIQYNLYIGYLPSVGCIVMRWTGEIDKGEFETSFVKIIEEYEELNIEIPPEIFFHLDLIGF